MVNGTVTCIEVSFILQQYGDLTLHKSVHIIFGTIYSLIFILGMLGNCSLVVSIITRKSLHSVANFLVANLAVSNILLCLTAVPVAPITLFLKKWFFGSLMCKLIPYSQGISVLISSLGLSAVATDRYRHIVDSRKLPWNSRHAFIIIGAIWGISGTVNLPLFLSQEVRPLYIDRNQTLPFCGEFCGEYAWANPKLRKIYGTVMLKIQFLFPVIMLTFCYSKIIQKVRREMIVAQLCLLTARQQVRAAHRKRRVMYILILMVAAFVLSWLPLSIVNILRDYDIRLGFVDEQLYFSQLIIHSIAMTSVIWNPILYFWMSKTQRRRIKRDFMSATRARRTSNPDYSLLTTAKNTPNQRRRKSHFLHLSPKMRPRSDEISSLKKRRSFKSEAPQAMEMKNGSAFKGMKYWRPRSCQASFIGGSHTPALSSTVESEFEPKEQDVML